MSIKRPTSEGQVCNEEPAIQQSYGFERNNFFLLIPALKTRCASLPVFCT